MDGCPFKNDERNIKKDINKKRYIKKKRCNATTINLILNSEVFYNVYESGLARANVSG